MWATIVTVLVLSTVGPRFPRVWAQGPSCLPGWEWNQNSLGQNPCVVGTALEASCRGDSSYTIRSLQGSTDYYRPPSPSNSLDLRCDCNIVMYSLYQACTTCQNGELSSWTYWVNDICPVVYVAQFPYAIPPGTEVPRWAFINVTSLPNQTYSDAAAIAIGRDPESTPVSNSGTVILGGTTTSVTPPSISSPSPSRTSGGSNNSKSQVGAIAGGVIGGGIALVILTAFTTFIIRRRRSKAQLPIGETSGYYPIPGHPHLPGQYRYPTFHRQ